MQLPDQMEMQYANGLSMDCILFFRRILRGVKTLLAFSKTAEILSVQDRSSKIRTTWNLNVCATSTLSPLM